MINKIKNNENSTLKVRINDGIIEKVVFDSNGEPTVKKIQKSHWEEANKEISLGSLNKPNKKILEVKYNIPKKQGNIFRNLFGG